MVSSKIKKELEELYQSLAVTSIDLFKYEEESFDVACEITTAESYIAGIADKIIENSRLHESDREILNRVFLTDGNNWLLEGVKAINLKTYPELLQSVEAIEKLRLKCLEALKARGN
jgi:hypothetical protein